MVEFQASWHILLLGVAAYWASRQASQGTGARTACARPSLDTRPCSPPPLPAGIPARWGPRKGLLGGEDSGVGSPGQGPRAGPGFLTCSPGPQKGALGPMGKVGRNLYMAGVGGLVLCADRVLSGGD